MSKWELKVIGLLSIVIVLSALGALRNYWQPELEQALKLALGPMYYVLLTSLIAFFYYRVYRREKEKCISQGIPMVRPAVAGFAILSIVAVITYLYFGVVRGNA